jgi:hypothetical protein
MPHVNFLAVLVSGVAIFILGALWYSPVLFAKTWSRLMGMTAEKIKAMMERPGAKAAMAGGRDCRLLGAAEGTLADQFRLQPGLVRRRGDHPRGVAVRATSRLRSRRRSPEALR